MIITLSITVTQKLFPPSLTKKWMDWNGFREEFEQRIELNVSLRTTIQLIIKRNY